MDLLVDPAVLYWCPKHGRTPTAIAPLDYLEYLVRSTTLIENPANQFYIPTRCEQALYHQDCFLDPGRLRNYFRIHYTGFPDVYRFCASILEKFWNWERFREDTNLPTARIVLTPDLCTRIPNQVIADSLRETLGYIAWVQQIHPIPDLHILTHPIGCMTIRIDVHIGGATVSTCLPIEVPP